jgi:predicted ATPase/DNA-binding XRE family transcriptional regulator
MQEEISFGTWLRRQRRALDLSQQALADKVGCAEVTLRRIEAGRLKPSRALASLILERIGVSEAERPQWVSFARGSSRLPFSSSSSAKKRASNLPAPITTFIGRETEQVNLIRLLIKHRLVTLTGPGGIGKTRLSVKVGEQVLENYADGVWLVELASLSDPALVPQTVAKVFGIQQGSTTYALVETLIHFLRAKQTLLIFDNCEHLLDACAQLIDQLLKSCPHLKVLATSREALGMIGEALYQVSGLTVPDIQRIESIEKISDYESIRLFGERAQLVQMDFALTAENVSSVAQICHRLGGIPLAIELAAVRVQAFSTEQIAIQLNERFHTLAGGNRTALPRHQTLKASIDWSWHLLYDSEQILLRRLSVFAGGFTLNAASQICSGLGIESRQVLSLISQLVTKSLIVANRDSNREKCYRLLETIRQYAHEKLVEAGEEESIRSQHLKYYLQLLEQAEPELKTPAQIDWNERFYTERDNIRAALEWASNTDIEAGLYLAGRLERFWEDIDLREGERWLTKYLDNPQSYIYPRARAKALYAYGIILYLTVQNSLLEKTAQECLELYRASGDQHGEIDGLILLARFMLASQKQARATELCQQALQLSESIGDLWRKALVLGHLGWLPKDFSQRFFYWEEAINLLRQLGDFRLLAQYLSTLGNYQQLNGDFELAQKNLDEAMQLNRLLKQKVGKGFILNALSRIETVKGNFEKAQSFLEDAIAVSTELGDRISYLWDRTHLGHVILQEGKILEAQDIFLETAEEFFKDRSEDGVVYALEGMACLYCTTDKPILAVRLIGWANATREKIGETRPLLEQADVDKIIATCTAKMGDVVFIDTYDEGKNMSLDEAVSLALEAR